MRETNAMLRIPRCKQICLFSHVLQGCKGGAEINPVYIFHPKKNQSRLFLQHLTQCFSRTAYDKKLKFSEKLGIVRFMCMQKIKSNAFSSVAKKDATNFFQPFEPWVSQRGALIRKGDFSLKRSYLTAHILFPTFVSIPFLVLSRLRT